MQILHAYVVYEIIHTVSFKENAGGETIRVLQLIRIVQG
jgi:hypothetical protein